MTSTIPDTTPYIIVDVQTGKTVHTGIYKNRNRIRNKADKMDLAYGSVRYITKVVYP